MPLFAEFAERGIRDNQRVGTFCHVPARDSLNVPRSQR
jgi:hypothetical protein